MSAKIRTYTSHITDKYVVIYILCWDNFDQFDVDQFDFDYIDLITFILITFILITLFVITVSLLKTIKVV